jgi:hypothetical protein
LFKSDDYKNGSQKDKKDLIGNSIYETVEKMIGTEKAPKITGMIIDLPDNELI